MPKTVLEKISECTVVTKEECVRSVATHMSNFKVLLERFENDNKLFATSQDETFKNIGQNNVLACQNKQTKVNEMIEHLIDRLDDNVPDDVNIKTESEKKRNDSTVRLDAAKLAFTELLTKYNKDKADKEK